MVDCTSGYCFPLFVAKEYTIRPPLLPSEGFISTHKYVEPDSDAPLVGNINFASGTFCAKIGKGNRISISGSMLLIRFMIGLQFTLFLLTEKNAYPHLNSG